LEQDRTQGALPPPSDEDFPHWTTAEPTAFTGIASNPKGIESISPGLLRPAVPRRYLGNRIRKLPTLKAVASNQPTCRVEAESENGLCRVHGGLLPLTPNFSYSLQVTRLTHLLIDPARKTSQCGSK